MRIKQASWIPLHIEKLTSANSTAVTISATAQEGRLLLISVETNDARLRFDSTAPQTSTGILIKKDLQPFVYEGYNGAAIKFIKAAGGTSIITIASFTLPS